MCTVSLAAALLSSKSARLQGALQLPAAHFLKCLACLQTWAAACRPGCKNLLRCAVCGAQQYCFSAGAHRQGLVSLSDSVVPLKNSMHFWTAKQVTAERRQWKRFGEAAKEQVAQSC